MNTINIPVQSVKTLIKASIAAVIIAAITLVTVILPAEYNIDPRTHDLKPEVNKWIKHCTRQFNGNEQQQQNREDLFTNVNISWFKKFKLKRARSYQQPWPVDHDRRSFMKWKGRRASTNVVDSRGRQCDWR